MREKYVHVLAFVFGEVNAHRNKGESLISLVVVWVMRCVVGGHPWSVEHLGQTELVPMGVGSTLQYSARARVDVKQNR